MGMTRNLVLLALLAASVAATTQASLAMMSKLRGFQKAPLVQQQQQQGHPLNALATGADKALVSYRRLGTDSTEADASAKANEVGASVREAIRQLRGGNDKFYHDLITAVKIWMCEQDVEKNSIHFVTCSADNAYKDDNGDAVRVTVATDTDDETVQAYAQDQCEVSPNCYWAEIVDGDTSRAKVYAYPESTMDSSAADAKIKEWATGVIGFVIPGIVLGVLSLLTMVFFLICRCCCNRCGGRFPREEGYRCMQKFLPLLFFLLFAIGVIGVSAAAFLYRGTMLTAVDDLFNATSGTLENGSAWIVDIKTPLVEIAATVVDSADNIKVKLDGTDFIDTGLSDITTSLDNIAADCTNRTIPKGCVVDTSTASNPNNKNVDKDGKMCVPCSSCNKIGEKAGAASSEMSSKAGPGVKQLGNVKGQLNTKLVEISGTVQSAVDTQVTTADDLIVTVDNTQADVNKYDTKFQGYRDQLGYAIMGLFALALVVLVIGFIGILFGLTPLKALANVMHVAYFLGFIALFLTFIISAIVLAIGVVLGDVCEVTEIFASNWTVPLGESAKAVDACFNNESLLDVFNLSDKLDFARGGIEFPDLNMDSMFNFQELNTFASTAANISESDFPFDEDAYQAALTLVNSYSKQSTAYCSPNDAYTLANVLTPWLDVNPASTSMDDAVTYIKKRYDPQNIKCAGTTSDYGKAFECSDKSITCTFSLYMGEIFDSLVQMAVVKKDIAGFVTDLKDNADSIQTSTATFETKTKQLDSDINVIKNDLDSSLIEYVGDFEAAMYCTFIADGFWTIYHALCGDLMPSITMIALMLFLCGIFLIPVNVCLIIGVKRLKAHGNGHIMDTEMKFK
ncbi:hypothetical protein PHYPSEUDO_000720 [Phytophthora pseudosyringae]|uniref:Prominin-like protein n=1 Tax=Phytophthora pseudosyringae TaxID=221518 RepID=A0A8T1VX74_9STRA|nr:hypothetical protein PHYPSEUDO_000720 [Phytophthora pseudosyringae]